MLDPENSNSRPRNRSTGSRRRLQPGFDYRDVWKEEHSNAFTVAKMLNADLLVEVRALVEQALEQGQTFAQFRRSSNRSW